MHFHFVKKLIWQIFFIFVSHFFHALVMYDWRHDDSFANQFKSVKICNFRILFQRALQNSASIQNFCQLLVFGEFLLLLKILYFFNPTLNGFWEENCSKFYDNKQWGKGSLYDLIFLNYRHLDSNVNYFLKIAYSKNIIFFPFLGGHCRPSS